MKNANAWLYESGSSFPYLIFWGPTGREYVKAMEYGGGRPRKGHPVAVFHERLRGPHGHVVGGLAETCTYTEWKSRSPAAWLARLRGARSNPRAAPARGAGTARYAYVTGLSPAKTALHAGPIHKGCVREYERGGPSGVAVVWKATPSPTRACVACGAPMNRRAGGA